MRRILYIVIILTLALAGCPAPRTLPDVPRVEFKSFILEKKINALNQEILTGTLTFDFEDGDGDIGFEASPDSLNAPDTVKYNLFLTLHEMVDGVYREVDTSELGSPPYYRIPPLDREGQNKTLKGEISVDIEYFTIDYDTLRYSFYLFDRAYHRSNVDTTDEIIFTDWK
ncbi:MAG: hypothetical protein AMS23_08165 [Bacteroides sp. SM1_62]|nr:MAG: hypothetical protein AMS26_12835 [Bacteroides sp. SM23_62]KPL22271.1 MAG: hypothetical protein AMS23_08165 [Bacteroides sp. SM1_62]